MLLKLLLLEVENAFFHLFFLSSGYMDSLKEGRPQARPKPHFFFYIYYCVLDCFTRWSMNMQQFTSYTIQTAIMWF